MGSTEPNNETAPPPRPPTSPSMKRCRGIKRDAAVNLLLLLNPCEWYCSSVTHPLCDAQTAAEALEMSEQSAESASRIGRLAQFP